MLIIPFVVVASNSELEAIYQEDMDELAADPERKKGVEYKTNAVKRIKRVKAILAKNGKHTAQEYFSAAMVFQHGVVADDYLQAHKAAKKAIEVDPSHSDANWLICSAEDRYLRKLGKPQVWGTQLVRQLNEDKTYMIMVLEEFDKTAKSDTERVKCGLPTVAEMERKVAVLATMTEMWDQYRYWRTGK